MPRGKKENRSPSGAGSIRKKTVKKNGKEYIYWEARLTVGYDPGTGKQKQRSFTGKTQKEVREKLQAAAVEVNNGTYREPSKLTLGQWLDTWSHEFLGNVKPFTVASYTGMIANHIKPSLGAVRMDDLSVACVQGFYNDLLNKKELSPKTIKNVHGVLHKALEQAVLNGIIRVNCSDACVLPRVEKKELKPLDECDIRRFLQAAQGHRFETLYTVTLFSGMREGEILGLTWDCIDFETGMLYVKKQLQKEKKTNGKYYLAPLKNDKPRKVALAPWVLQLLSNHKTKQEKMKNAAGEAWCNPDNLVFTNELGGHLVAWTVLRNFKEIAAKIGRPDARFHDLRHSYAVAAIRSGDDIKTVQGNLGHATASFTLDVYGHVTDQMKQASANRMDRYIKNVLEL